MPTLACLQAVLAGVAAGATAALGGQYLRRRWNGQGRQG